MAKTITEVANNDTFEVWLLRTNELCSMAAHTLTATNTDVAFPSDPAAGNVVLNGTMSAQTFAVNTAIHGGQVGSLADLKVTSNLHVTGANTYIQGTNTTVTSNSTFSANVNFTGANTNLGLLANVQISATPSGITRFLAVTTQGQLELASPIEVFQTGDSYLAFAENMGNHGTAVANGTGSIAIGSNADSSAAGSITIGINTDIEDGGDEGIVIGANSTIEDATPDAIVIGHQARANQDASIVIGFGSKSNGASSGHNISLGVSVDSNNSSNSVSIGRTILTDGGAVNAVSIGTAITTSNTDTISIGTTASGNAADSIALGRTSKAHAVNAIAIGVGSLTDATSQSAVAIGALANASTNNAISIGYNARQATATGINSVVIGGNANTGGANTVAIGMNSNAATNNAIALGYGAAVTAGNNSIAIGTGVSVGTANTIQIGADATYHAYLPGSLDVGQIASDLVADSDNARSLGNSSIGWTDLHLTNILSVDGIATVGQLDVTANATIGTSGNTVHVDVTSGSVGMRTTLPEAALHVAGSILAEGDVTSGYTSDERLKEDILDMDYIFAMDKVLGMRGVQFTWKEGIESEYINPKSGTDIGLLAQEVESVLPEVVRTYPDGYKGIDYAKIVPVLIEAIKGLNSRVEELESQVHTHGDES